MHPMTSMKIMAETMANSIMAAPGRTASVRLGLAADSAGNRIMKYLSSLIVRISNSSPR
jgi:hypothetical protein